MARYLTPSKVALLTLISIYIEGAVPNSAIVPILSFLVSHLLPLDSPDSIRAGAGNKGSAEDSTQTILSIEEIERATSVLGSSIPGRTIWDIFLKKIWQFDCSDALDEFISKISNLMYKTREERIQDRNNGVVQENPNVILLSRSSPLGSFVRRAQLEYTRLQFHDSMALWRAFIKYRIPTYRAWFKRNPMECQSTVDVNLSDLGLGLNSPLAMAVYGKLDDDTNDEDVGMSIKDVERLLEFQVSEMQSKGSRVSREMKSTLEKLIVSGATVPSLSHYVRFLDSWKAGDYPSSFDHLHRYFDYTIQSRDRTFYQYALLNLAIIQADFGCHGESVSAIQEAISIARETHDMNCLNFCMSWLYHFGKTFPDELKEIQNTGMLGSEKEALAFLQAKAKETEMWSLLSTSLLSEAKLELLNGESIASAFEHIVKASHITVTKDRGHAMGPQLMLQAAIFGRLGISHLSWSNCEAFRECYSNLAPFDDYLRATCRSSQLFVLNGRYDEAIAQMNDISPSMLHTLKSQHVWTFYSSLLKLRRQLHHDDKLAAKHLITQLEGCAPPDPELSISLTFLKVDLSMREGDYDTALKVVDKLSQSIQPENLDVATQIKLLIMKARVFEKTGQPERGFSLAMRAASLAHRSRVLPGLWEAVNSLSAILMNFREFEAAADILESIVPQVLQCGDRALGARTYSSLVDANMGLAGQTRTDVVRQKEYLAGAAEFIDCAFEEFSAVEDVRGQCEMMAKKATLMHLSGDLVLANDYASKYLDLKRQAGAERY